MPLTPADPFASPASSIRDKQESSSDEERRPESNENPFTPAEPSAQEVAATLANATAFAVSSRIPSALSLGGASTPYSYSGWNTPYSSVTPMHSSVPLPLPNTPGSRPQTGNNHSPTAGAFSTSTPGSSANLTKRTNNRMKSTLLPALLPSESSETNLSLSSKTPTAQPVVPKPWLSSPSRNAWFARHRISRFLVYFLIFLGLGLGGMQCYLTYRNVKFNRMDNQPLCLVLEENFDSEEAVFGSDGASGGTFWREVDMSGGGNGQFEMTTNSQKNSYVRDGMLYLLPTLTDEEIGTDNVFGNNSPYIYNITGCTFNQTQGDGGFITDPEDPTGQRKVFDYSNYYRACSATSNSTTGSIVNPVQSARVSTRLNAIAGLNGNTSVPIGSLKTGRLSIRARLPTGDWLWPALWLLPANNTYGTWPRSGEIDMVESRGNGIEYTANGANFVQGSLHWGPEPGLNGQPKSYSWWSRTRGDPKTRGFDTQFHEYVMEWTEEWIRIYVDSRLHTLLEYRFDQPFWLKGDFPNVARGSDGQLAVLEDPWGEVDGLGVTGDGSVASGGTGNPSGKGTLPSGSAPSWAAPFDQEFYLIMNVAVGSTNGWFPDGQGGYYYRDGKRQSYDKPWLNGAANAMRAFASAKDVWYQTWPQGDDIEQRAMVVDYVKMWRHC